MIGCVSTSCYTACLLDRHLVRHSHALRGDGASTALRYDGWLLCRFSGMTKRAVAEVLNLSSGAAVGSQIRKLMKVLKDDDALYGKVKKTETCLEEQCNQ